MPEPPRLAEQLLLRLVGGRDGQVIAGDLAESYEERGGGALWYWGQVLSCILVRLSPHRRLIPDLNYDVHHAFRLIRRNPGYALAAVLCLALGIGINTTVFSVLDGMFLRGLPLPDPGRIVTLDRDGASPCSISEYFELRKTVKSLVKPVAVIARNTYLDVGPANEPVYIETVMANYADVLQTKPGIGRWFAPSDEQPHRGLPVVISDRLWMRYFQREPNTLGRTIRLEGQIYTIVGVARPEFRGVSSPISIDAWVPLASFPLNRADFDSTTDKAGPDVSVISRLAPHVTLRQARAEIAVFDAHIRAQSKNDPRLKAALTVEPILGFVSRRARRSIAPLALLLAGVVGIVLLIACVNVANLLLARAAVRQREMAVRLSLGATRSRLIRQTLAEGLVLAAGGAVLGLMAGFWTNQALSAWLPTSFPQAALRTVFLEINWRVAALTAAISVLSALLFSLAPAFETARTECTPALKGEGGGSSQRAMRRRDLYAAAQVALSLALLIAAGLLLRALDRAASIDPGFATARRIYLRLFTPGRDFTPEASTQLFTRLVESARQLPGVQDATLSFALLGFGDRNCASTGPAAPTRKLHINVVEPNYFHMMQVPLVKGEGFQPNGHPESILPVIVNETMARTWWPGQDAVGQPIWFGCESEHQRLAGRVIGIARDSKYQSLDEEPLPLYYVSTRQFWWNGYLALIVETRGEPREIVEPLLALARTGGRNLRIGEVNTLESVVSLSLWYTRFYASLLGLFAALAIVLSTIGLYGVVAYSVAQRTREIGIRMAMGARRSDVQWMVLARALRLTAFGIAAGLLLSAAATRLLRHFLHGLSPLDPVTFTAAALAWIAISMLASYVPSLRATRVDPTVALRYE